MQFLNIAKVAIENAMYYFDKEYDYIIPNDLLDVACIGCRVIIPFGRGNSKRQGIILEVNKCYDVDDNVKSILTVLDQAPLLNNEMISLARWMKCRYYCTIYDAIKVMLPLGISIISSTLYTVSNKINNLKDLSEQEKSIIDYLISSKVPIQEKKIIKYLNLDCDDSLLKQMLKKGLLMKYQENTRRVNDAMLKMVKLKDNEFIDDIKLSDKQKSVCELISMMGAVSIKEVCYFLGITVSVLNTLKRKNIVEYFDQEVYRDPFKLKKYDCDNKEITLNEEQLSVYNSIYDKYKNCKSKVSLLYGVTGSGKTSVFMKLIEEVHKDGKGIIVMVPEISLTPRLIDIFKSRYGDKVAIFHSALSLGERLDEWKRVKKGLANIVVGTRSAIFAPLKNVGLIIMDEEHEYTYKSDSNPRYHAKDIAKFRINYNNGLLLLCSATPSIEDFYLANKNIYSLHKLITRYGGANLPSVSIIDMNLEVDNGNTSSFSKPLVDALKDNLNKKMQSIILLNRRGYNTFVVCKSCGQVLFCPNCSISMTYHSANNRLMCHCCGYSKEFINECPSCHDNNLLYKGFGTQRAEHELKLLFPQASILRMDTDSTMVKFSHERKLKDFADGKYDIMIGTQMVAKGLDFPNVTLVGVLSADKSLYNEDFRSYERTFSLLTQVIGRAGRGQLKGCALIQTFTPENPIISLASNQDYLSYYNSEIQMRKAMLYPPFADICIVGFMGNVEEKTFKASKLFFDIFTDLASNEYEGLPLKVFSPSSALVAKVSNKYRYRIVIKFKNNKKFMKLMSKAIIKFNENKKYNKVSLFVDINPDRII